MKSKILKFMCMAGVAVSLGVGVSTTAQACCGYYNMSPAPCVSCVSNHVHAKCGWVPGYWSNGYWYSGYHVCYKYSHHHRCGHWHKVK